MHVDEVGRRAVKAYVDVGRCRRDGIDRRRSPVGCPPRRWPSSRRAARCSRAAATCSSRNRRSGRRRPRGGLAAGDSGREFDLLSGTSMSSPHVAGLGALLTQAHPRLVAGGDQVGADDDRRCRHAGHGATADGVRAGRGSREAELGGRPGPRLRRRVHRLARLPRGQVRQLAATCASLRRPDPTGDRPQPGVDRDRQARRRADDDAGRSRTSARRQRRTPPRSPASAASTSRSLRPRSRSRRAPARRTRSSSRRTRPRRSTRTRAAT